MVPRGLEPRTLRLLAVRSNQLSYETHVVCRACQCCSLELGQAASSGASPEAFPMALGWLLSSQGSAGARGGRVAVARASQGGSGVWVVVVFLWGGGVLLPAAAESPLPLPCPKNAKLLLQPRRLGAATWHF